MVILTRRGARQAAGLCGSAVLTVTGMEFESFCDGLDEAGQNTPDSATMRRTRATKKRSSPVSSPCGGAAGDSASGPSAASGVLPNSDGGTALPSRRPIRPVDRQKMLDWLVVKLDREEMPRNLWWVEKGKVFAVKWAHAARQGFKSAQDACLFKAWALHTGLYQEGDLTQDHKRWKANFRCAIHSLPDVKEMITKDGRKGPNAARIYKILDEPQPKKAKLKNRPLVADDENKGEDSDSGVSTDTQDNQDSLPLPVASLLETPTGNSAAEERGRNIPDFQRLGLPGLTCVQQNHLSGGCVKVMETSTSPTIVTLPPGFFTPHTSTENPASSSSSCSPSPTSSIPVSVTSPTLPREILEEMMGMRPVGIMTVSPPARGRTPSGDSGVPGSPSLTLENWTGEVVDEVQLDFSGEVIEEITADEGIGLYEIGLDISNGTEVQCCRSVQQNVSFNWMTGELLDISHNVPAPAVMMEVTTGACDDYQYTAMDME